MYNRLDSIPACARGTARQTDILPRHSPRYAYASRGKNHRSATVHYGPLQRTALSLKGRSVVVISPVTHRLTYGTTKKRDQADNWSITTSRVLWMSPTSCGRRPGSIQRSVSAMPWRHFGTWPCRTIAAAAPGDVDFCRQESPRCRRRGGVTAGRHARRCCLCPAQSRGRATLMPTDRRTGQRRTRRPDFGCASPSRATSYNERLW